MWPPRACGSWLSRWRWRSALAGNRPWTNGAARKSSCSHRLQGAIKVDENLYMVEIGVDDRGCRMYSAWSNTRAVVAAVHYRDVERQFLALPRQGEMRRVTAQGVSPAISGGAGRSGRMFRR